MSSEIFAGVVLLIAGILNIIKPEVLIHLRIFLARKIYGAAYKPTAKTYQVQRVIGVIFVILGFLIVAGMI